MWKRAWTTNELLAGSRKKYNLTQQEDKHIGTLMNDLYRSASMCVTVLFQANGGPDKLLSRWLCFRTCELFDKKAAAAPARARARARPPAPSKTDTLVHCADSRDHFESVEKHPRGVFCACERWRRMDRFKCTFYASKSCETFVFRGVTRSAMVGDDIRCDEVENQI